MNQNQPIAQFGYQEALAYLYCLLPRSMEEMIDLLAIIKITHSKTANDIAIGPSCYLTAGKIAV